MGERWRLADALPRSPTSTSSSSGLQCPLEELERRERERGNRPIGLAAFQFPIVHENMRYDIELDTSANDPAACAAQIKTFLAEGRTPTGPSPRWPPPPRSNHARAYASTAAIT